MIEYNNATKKFLKNLEKHFKDLHLEITAIINLKYMDKIALENSGKKSVSIKTFNGKNEDVELGYIESGLNYVQATNPELIQKYGDYRYIIDLIQGMHAFNEYDILQEIFRDLHTNEMQQIEVLGYLLKYTASAFISIDEKIIEAKSNPDITVDRDFYMNFITKGEEDFEKHFGASVIKKCKEGLANIDLEKRFKEDIRVYKVIDQYIDDNGVFIGADNPDALKEALSYESVRMTDEQINMIIRYVLNKYIKEQEKLTKRETIIAEPAMSPIINFVDKKERWLASKTLKSYLVNNFPVKLISSEEFIEITNALITLGVSDEEIARIQKNIVSNNEKLISDQEQNNFIKAKEKYLSESEISLLDSVDAILNSKDLIVNPTFNIIKSDYEFIKSELTRLYKLNDDNNVELNDNAILIIDAIEEIEEKIPEYLYSDYRFTRNLTKKEEPNE